MSARRVVAVLLTVASLSSSVPAAEKNSPGEARPKPLKGNYQVYGGTLSEILPPTKNDRKVSFMFTGPLARELFDQIGPDIKDACGAGPDHRTRYRGDLSCIWTKEDGHVCYFGLDVPTGKSTNGSIC